MIAPTDRAVAEYWRLMGALDECRDYALAAGERFGVWGGMTAKTRTELIETTERNQE